MTISSLIRWIRGKNKWFSWKKKLILVQKISIAAVLLKGKFTHVLACNYRPKDAVALENKCKAKWASQKSQTAPKIT
jgi:hypothetical protein